MPTPHEIARGLSVKVPARRTGKSLHAATLAAEAIKAGMSVLTWTAGNGLERVVGVPGFDDGRQLPETGLAVRQALMEGESE